MVELRNGQVQKQGRGCWFYGCLTVIALVILGAIALYFGARHFLNKMVETYSTTAPLSIPSLPLTQEQYDTASARVSAFRQALESGAGPEEITLSSSDINALIMYHPDWNFLKDRAVVDIQNNEVRGRISIPLEKIGFEGRFLNAEGKFKINLENGWLNINPEFLNVNGQPLPETILEELRKEDLSGQMLRDPKAREFFKKIESIKVQGDSILIKRRHAKAE